MITFEQFALGVMPPERLWSVVGDPWRLPEWTDVERITAVAPEPVAVGSMISAVDGGRSRDWRVVTAEDRLLELVTEVDSGRIGLGVRVLPDPDGARMVLACAYRGRDSWAEVRFRLFGASGVRRRFDRWSAQALRVAEAEAG